MTMAAAMWIRVLLLAAACLLPLSVEARVRHYKFNVSALYAVFRSLMHANMIINDGRD